MSLAEFKMDDNVAVVTLNSGENRFNPEFLDAFLNILDEIENNTDANVLIVQSAHEKIFSNGIDLDWLLPYVQSKDIDTCKAFFYNDLMTDTNTNIIEMFQSMSRDKLPDFFMIYCCFLRSRGNNMVNDNNRKICGIHTILL